MIAFTVIGYAVCLGWCFGIGYYWAMALDATHRFDAIVAPVFSELHAVISFLAAWECKGAKP